MTREEAKKEVTLLRPMYHDEIYDLLDEIYNDIKSMTCENCKHGNIINKIGNYECCIGVSDEHIKHTFDECEEYISNKDFGCNKFKRKDKHNEQHGDRLDKVYYGNKG